DLLAAGQASAPAISAPGLTPLDYGNLRAFVHQMQGVLRSLGVAQGDRVAIVLPNGPEMAVAFLAVASAATAAPLNPAYKAEEFEFYLTDLGAKLLIALDGEASVSIEVARRLGVPVALLTPTPEVGAGAFRLQAPGASTLSAGAAAHTQADADAIALVLHTSGTTSRPKIVP